MKFPFAMEQKKDQANPKYRGRLILVCFLLLYLIVVLLLCFYAGTLRRPSITFESNSSGAYIPPAPLTGEIDLNTADQETLCLLPGIGEKLSQAILDYRAEYQGFDFAEDVMYVNGIGEKRLQNIWPYITLSEKRP